MGRDGNPIGGEPGQGMGSGAARHGGGYLGGGTAGAGGGGDLGGYGGGDGGRDLGGPPAADGSHRADQDDAAGKAGEGGPER
ncbi:MAG TPA: hypothetical protein VFR81_08295 [Longimicrobium sp.]|nr:hypothetical protein [Longimicrobium sp.]